MDGTVKEYISDGDYQISVDAAISGTTKIQKILKRARHITRADEAINGLVEVKEFNNCSV
ncbi:hypothetical protein E5F92_009210 [Flavobacterium columnare]|nr:hypothetical protein [Flavobacterium columnare]